MACLFQPASSQERGSGLAVGRQGGPGSAGGPGAVDQARDLSPCLPASMGDAARPTTLPCSPPAAHHHGPHHTPLHQTHCGTNNNCYDGPTTPYDSRDYDSPAGSVILHHNLHEIYITCLHYLWKYLILYYRSRSMRCSTI